MEKEHIDFKQLTNDCVEWIRNWFNENGKGCKAVIGISGGKDSTVIAHLCAKALGPENVIGVMMPNGIQKDIEDSKRTIKSAGIKGIELPITEIVSEINYELIKNNIKTTNQTNINIPPRIRMTMLYAIAQSSNGRVVGTGNLDERLLGYYTLWGDGACDMNPIGMLTVGEIIEIGKVLEIDEDLLIKSPSDGLTGKTDEESLGFSYKNVDKYIFDEHNDDFDKIEKRINDMKWKQKLTNIPMFMPKI